MATLAWLEGTWERTDMSGEKKAFEIWKRTDDGFSGIGFTMRGQDTTFVEHLRIVAKDGHLHYVATVDHNPGPVYFRMRDISEKGFVAENPAHDFPKRIGYERNGQTMTAVVSAGDQGFSVKFRKLE